MENVELDIEPAALSAMARKAMERKTGARGLRSILEGALLDTMYELPGMDSVGRVVVNEQVITAGVKPAFLPREANAEPEAA